MAATRITFTGDVLSVSTAGNDDGSIRWHVYDRDDAGVPRIYVQREVAGTLEPEQQILVEGRAPKVSFDDQAKRFLILYSLNENVFLVSFAEAEVPTLQPAQVGDTATDHMRPGLGGLQDDADGRTFDERIQTRRLFGVRTIDAYNGPALVDRVALAAALNPSNLLVRWRAKADQFGSLPPSRKPIEGYRVFRVRADNSQQEFLGFVAYTGLDPTVYELEVTAVPGRYYVAQVDRAGPQSTRLVVGRAARPGDEAITIPTELPDVNRSRMSGLVGEGRPIGLLLGVVETAPIVVIGPLDPQNSPVVGEAFRAGVRFELVADFGETAPSIETDAFDSPILGRGYALRLTQTGFGTVIIT